MSKRLRGLICVFFLAGALTACGGSSNSGTTPGGTGTSPPPDDPLIPETVTGVATPSNVSVVTATNAD